MKEVRFRDILACEENWLILKEVIKRTYKEHSKINSPNLQGFIVIGREFPLIRDKVGYQLRYVDILAVNEDNDFFIIELKKKYQEKTNIKNIFDQINEYENLLAENFEDIKKSEDYLSIFHFYQKEILNYMNIPLEKRKRIYKLILFMETSTPSDNLNINHIPIGFFNQNEIKLLTKNYFEHRINLIETLTPGFKSLLINESVLNDEKVPKFRPIPLTMINNNFFFRFEAFDSNTSKQREIDRSLIKENWHLPRIYKDDFKSTLEHHVIEKLNRGKFYIQIFRSGRANPIFYLEYENDKYLVLNQIKSRILKRVDPVNTIIAEDASGMLSIKSKKTIFEEVIFFDVGNYRIEQIEDNGIQFKRCFLDGVRYDIKFEIIGPKIRNDLSKVSLKAKFSGKKIPPLLPFMTNEEIQNHIRDYKNKYGINPFTNEWIITNIRATPKS